MNALTKVTRENNTFEFFVREGKVKLTLNSVACKIVKIVQYTDFTGTSLEEDFPNGDTSVFEIKTLPMSDIEAVNFVGNKMIENWEFIS